MGKKGDFALDGISKLILVGGGLFVIYKSGILDKVGEGLGQGISKIGDIGTGLGSGLSNIGGGVFGLGQGLGGGLYNIGAGVQDLGAGIGGAGFTIPTPYGMAQLGLGANTPSSAWAQSYQTTPPALKAANSPEASSIGTSSNSGYHTSTPATSTTKSSSSPGNSTINQVIMQPVKTIQAAISATDAKSPVITSNVSLTSAILPPVGIALAAKNLYSYVKSKVGSKK